MMKRALLVAIAAAVVSPFAISAQEDVSVTANAGWNSLYYYRGILQSPTSANAGLDVAVGDMFSAGTWGADVGDGSEIDLYAGLALPTGDAFSLSVGGTGYFYTGETFDKTYLEANVGLGIGMISVDLALGQHTLGSTAPKNEKYSYLGVTVEQNGLYATVASLASAQKFGDAVGNMFKFDFPITSGTPDPKDTGTFYSQYLEAGYAFSAADLDFVIAGIWTGAEAADDGNGYNELSLTFGVSKTFDISGGM